MVPRPWVYEDELERECTRKWVKRIRFERHMAQRKQHAHHEVVGKDLLRVALVCAVVVVVLGYWLWRSIYG